MTDSRERQVTEAFVALAGSLAQGADVVDLLSELTTRCAAMLDVASAGALLADAEGTLHVVAASSERTRNLELFQLQREDGPCSDCFREGRAVSVPDIHQAQDRWPHFAPAAVALGFASVHALPMQLGTRTLGTLGLFGTSVGPLNDEDRALGQALAHVASVALVQNRVATDNELVTQQLQTALNSRVVLEQAKGVLAQQGGLDMEQAFAALRQFARDHNLRLTDVARAVVSRELTPQRVVAHAASR